MAVRLRWLFLGAAVAGAVLLLYVATGASTKAKEEGQKAAQSTTPTKTTKTSVSTDQPEPPSVLSRPSTTTPEESAALERGVQKMRERAAAKANAKRYRGGGAGSGAPVGRPTKVAAEAEAPVTTKNFRNTVAQQVSSTLAEPAADADQREVLYAGNTYLSRSTDGGASWVNAGAYPVGPADALEVCCDPDVVHASNTDTTFNTIVYLNNAAPPTNGVVRIFVRQGTISDGVDCTYLIDPARSRDDNIIPDYPHLAISNNFLYLSTDNYKNGTEWVSTKMIRWPLQQISNCQTITNRTFTYDNTSIGNRVHVPVENATTTMYWGQLDNATTFRIYSWPESQSTPSQVTRSVASTNFTNPDCRGGTGDFDWIEKDTAYSIHGYRMRGATTGETLRFLWPAHPDSPHTQAHLHGAVFRTSDLALIAQPPVFNNTFCYGYPALGANNGGEYALSVAFGGDKFADSGSAAQAGVAVDEVSRPVDGFGFPPVQTTARGTHNTINGRWGDYFTVRNNERCRGTWNATNYALISGNTLPRHVNARYVEFQSSSHAPCQVPPVPPKP